ncbi:xyloglucan endotransglucosylase/hydrolase protein 3-like [Olea europaea var. sylvestris]|uniref:xyloglucan endotransglucosylase/hydrolase protein 3-like n=1 Tax=Olea europaea var. sylvestris TaxID=158386 RepID=UPI000C1D8B14|nr:xyloglucan endotransglucosylase/hydrolase protein 3-like [Olea europaea var. sylvestris]
MALLNLIVLTILLGFLYKNANGAGKSFNQFYSPLWGLNHLTVNPQGTEVQLLIDQSSGAGFRSHLEYGSGLFRIRMKIPERRTGGVVTTFYLTSAPDNQDPGNHFELDYEFLGTNGTLQTNVYDNDGGHREQSFRLWFNPSQDFHAYEILWNRYQIVFYIDGIPIREFKKHTDRGVDYPWKPMHIEASIWNADWAGVVDWSQAPFIAHYKGFNFNACPAQINDVSHCNSLKYFWNKMWLKPKEKMRMRRYRKAFMSYDYCSNLATRKPECSWNN